MSGDVRVAPASFEDILAPFEQATAVLPDAPPPNVVDGLVVFHTRTQADAWHRFFCGLSNEECERNGILRLSFLRFPMPGGPTQSNTLNPFV